MSDDQSDESLGGKQWFAERMWEELPKEKREELRRKQSELADGDSA
jgi:hypothetical protein